MQIKVDKEGAEAIRGLCHCALKMAGMDNLLIVNKVLAHLDYPGKSKPEPVVPEKPEQPDEKKKE